VTPSAAASQDLPALTALRALAALLVFVYHFAPKGLPWLPGVLAGQGHVGVTVFFVLSGFLITVRYYPQFARGERALGAYFVKRVARILPLYFVVLTLTHWLTGGAVPLDAAHLPEWTLTQALFGSFRPDDITVPTSWSLTVEECFYASAPLLFLGAAAVRRRLGPVAGTLALLGAATTAVCLTGSLLLRLTAGVGTTALPFLSDAALLRYYTIFGRIPDFALGAAAGFLFLSGRVEEVWRRARGAWIASALAAGGAVLLVAGQAGMARNPGAEWRWNLLVAFASALTVLALTCRPAPLSRLLSLAPLVYLGRISYALYLIQLTPLGSGLLSRLLPGSSLAHMLVLYAGMNVVAALLFELVEEPARETIVGLWRRRSPSSLPPARGTPARALSLAILFGALAAQHVLWALGSLAPVDETRVLQVLGAGSQAVVQAQVAPPAAGDREPRVRLPPSWRESLLGDQWAPRSLLVFVDGRPVPFLGARPPETPDTSAYYRGWRSGHVSLQITDEASVTVVNNTPLVAMALAGSGLVEEPIALVPPLLLLGTAGGAFRRTRRSAIWAPRTCLALAVGLVTLWLVAGMHLVRWAPVVVFLELAGLVWLLLSRRDGQG
jgi:peptidoglycan/LPS O-acetylase OafA/YrhL